MQILHDLNGISDKKNFTLEDQWKAIGKNILMSAAFHGGGKLWGRAANAVGVEKARGAAEAERVGSRCGEPGRKFRHSDGGGHRHG
jgi:hypothetical protein